MRFPSWVYVIGIALYIALMIALVLSVKSDGLAPTGDDSVVMCSPSYPC